MINKFYLDKEKDIIVNLFKSKRDEITYILETPHHNTGNLITNLAKLCGVETIKNEKDMKIITGTIPASINGDNEEVYVFRLGGIKIANIYYNRIEIKAKIPAITKTLMSQTKNYKLPIEKTIVKTYILKKSKFRTDLHTHMNANLSPDCLISLGIMHQVRYPLYYIKKLNLILSKEQEEKIYLQRSEVEKQFIDSPLQGKYLTRKIDDNTFINFADFILNNLENAQYNIEKIRTSLAILKDGQAVFTNLEKTYIYRYVFAKGIPSTEEIKLTEKVVKSIPENNIVEMVLKMMDDKKNNSPYKNNSLRQDKFLWIAREYQKQGIFYVEIADTELAKVGEPVVKLLQEVHDIFPEIERETGVKIRFLLAIRRIALTIIKDQKTSNTYLKDTINVLKAVAKSPYVVGSDFIGEEINDISDLQPVIQEIVKYVEKEDKYFTIRIHAGENDSLRDNVRKSILCVKEALAKGQQMPRVRIGHGLYSENLDSEKGKELLQLMKENGVVVEFQLTSNVRLNNISDLTNHPIKKFLRNGVKCVQGTDGCGFYGSDTFDEQLALQNLLGLTENDFAKMREVEDEIIEHSDKYFKEKSKKFEKFLAGRTIKEAVLELEEKKMKETENQGELRASNDLDTETELKQKITTLPTDKVPIIIAGGSFNTKGRETYVTPEGIKLLKELIKNIDNNKVYFAIGHKMQGYEKAIIDISKELNKKFEINAIVPKVVTENVKDRLLDDSVDGICISTESEELGIYKSFNYEIFERRKSIVIAFDGNSPVLNLVQEAKNGKGKSKIYVNQENQLLREKADTLDGYVVPFEMRDNIVNKIFEDNPEILSDNKTTIYKRFT
ncbi:MAG: adenosine deaminase [Clostridia bacterium]|nr:adenosine deaminase [Clostridia bacterium]